MSEKQTFGQWLRKRRQDLQLRAKECANRAGMTPQEWSDWETGRSRRKDGTPPQPTLSTCKEIARGLGISLSEVLKAAGAEEIDRRFDYREIDKQTGRVEILQGTELDALRQLSPAEVKARLIQELEECNRKVKEIIEKLPDE